MPFFTRFEIGQSWAILSPIEQSIKRKIEAVGKPLKEWDVKIYRGILTGCNDAFIIDGAKKEELIRQDTRSAEIIRPILRGRDIKRYGYEFADKWLIATFPSKHYDINQYPAVKRHLLSFGRERLEQSGKTHKINGEIIKSRKKTNNKWFETQDSISYWEDFGRQKIIYPNMTKFLPFNLDSQGYFTNDKCFILIGNRLEYLSSFLNSFLFRFCYIDSFPPLGNDTREMRKVFFREISIKEIDSSTGYRFKEAIEDSSLTNELKYMKINDLVCEVYNINEEEKI